MKAILHVPSLKQYGPGVIRVYPVVSASSCDDYLHVSHK